MDWAKTTARRDEKHLSLGIWFAFIRCFVVFLDASLEIRVESRVWVILESGV